MKIRLEWKPADLWVGAFFRREAAALHVWICVLPMLPLHLTFGRAPATTPDQHATQKRLEASRSILHPDLRGIDAQGMYLFGFNFFQADLEGANLSGANLENASFINANLRYAILENANLTGANFYNANLEGALLTGAILTRASLSGANTKGIDLSVTIRD